MKRRIIGALVALSLTIGTSTIVLGADYSSNIIVNNETLALDKIYKNEKEQLMFPIRVITEKLNYLLKWKNEDRSIELSKGNDLIKLKIDELNISVNGKQIKLNNSPMVKNGNTLIPIEFFEQALNLNLGWDSDKKVLKITNPTEKVEEYFEISEDEIVRKNIDNYMNLLNEYKNFQGSLLVAKDDKLLLSKGYGLLNVDQDIQNQSQTKFAIGSVTKQFTAMAIMQLVEQDLINVEDKVIKYIPELSEGKNITIKNLLTHTSGLVEFTTVPEFFQSDLDNDNPMIMVNLIKDKELEFKPGETFQYNNTNYLLLGMIVEKITGDTLEDYLEANILNPLNMKNTGVAYGKDKILPDATPYSGFIEVQEIDDKPVLSQVYGAGNMYSTVEDLYRWDRALKTEKLVSKETLNEIFKSHIMIWEDEDYSSSYGYGWFISDSEERKLLWHGGNTLGFTASIERNVDEDLTVIALSNKGHYNLDELSYDIGNISLNKSYDNPEKLEEIELENKEVYKKYIGRYDSIDNGSSNIKEENGRLFVQMKELGVLELFPQSENEFFAKRMDIKIEFTDIDEKTSILTLERLGRKLIFEKTDEVIEELEVADIDTEIYEDYVGEYALTPSVMVMITNEDDRIYAKLTGQDKFEILPLSESEYFYKMLDAKIFFERDSKGDVIGLILHQNELEMPASKI